MRKTKIVCTLGPASDTEEVIAAMADAGMNVARINFSHGTHEEHAKKIAMIKKIRKEKNIPLPVLLDTKGPEFRIRTFKNGKRATRSPLRRTRSRATRRACPSHTRASARTCGPGTGSF